MYYRTRLTDRLTESAAITAGIVLVALACLVLPRVMCYLRRRPARGKGYTFLQISGWLLLVVAYLFQARVMGILLPGFWVLTCAGLIVAMIVEQHRRGQREMLLGMISSALKRQQPLAPVLEMFGRDAVGWTAEAGNSVAQALESGIPFDTALEHAGDPLGESASILVRMGREVNDLGGALKSIVDIHRQTGPSWRAFSSRCCYLAAVFIVMFSVIAFAMVHFVPTLSRIFREYKLEVPLITEITIGISEFIAEPGWDWLDMPLSWLIVPIGLLGIYFAYRFVASSQVDLPRAGRIALPLHRASILEALALAADNGRPLESATALLTAIYPRRSIRMRLARAHIAMLQGTEWIDSLHGAALLRKADVGALRAAQRLGNLPWTMRELAFAARRRLLQRAQIVSHVVFPLILAGLGLMVATIVISLLLPITHIIHLLT